MKIGFDIDDTLIDLRLHAFHIYNRKLNRELDIEAFRQIRRVEIHEPFGMTDQEGATMWKDTLEEIYFTDCPPFPGAVEVLNELARLGHEIYYITARPEAYGERTKEWMRAAGFPVEDSRFHYGMQDDEKIHIIEKLDLDIYVDDKPAILETLRDHSLRIFVKDQTYNTEMKVPRIIDWQDFFGEISN